MAPTKQNCIESPTSVLDHSKTVSYSVCASALHSISPPESPPFLHRYNRLNKDEINFPPEIELEECIVLRHHEDTVNKETHDAAAEFEETRQKPKFVSFCRNVIVRGSLHLKDYSEEEKQNSWYSVADLRSIRQEARQEVRFFESYHDEPGAEQVAEQGIHHHALLSSCGLCRRGLEVHMYPHAQRRRKDRGSAARAVFEEQDLQHEEGSWHPDLLALVYTRATIAAKCRARAIGFRDQLQ